MSSSTKNNSNFSILKNYMGNLLLKLLDIHSHYSQVETPNKILEMHAEKHSIFKMQQQ